jgi:hypothetical protein
MGSETSMATLRKALMAPFLDLRRNKDRPQHNPGTFAFMKFRFKLALS